jgi:16S rRNA (uracil1498-N3)-methyltransferase
MPRIFCSPTLSAGASIALPANAARHVQVLRMQPGHSLKLFDGTGGQWSAVITHMGRIDVQVRVQTHEAVECEAPRAVHIALGVPANERMDWLVEKATELGATSIQPLMTERTVLRLAGERALKKQAHWQAIAIAACEQCGRNRVPLVGLPMGLQDWFTQKNAAESASNVAYLLSFSEHSQSASTALQDLDASVSITLLSGPEGGLSATEEALALSKGFTSLTLGPRVLRAETAPLAFLAASSLAHT